MHRDRHGSPALKNTKPSDEGDAVTNATMSLVGF